MRKIRTYLLVKLKIQKVQLTRSQGGIQPLLFNKLDFFCSLNFLTSYFFKMIQGVSRKYLGQAMKSWDNLEVIKWPKYFLIIFVLDRVNQKYISTYIWYKIKLTLRPHCFVVDIFLVDGVRDTNFKVLINMKIYICKIQDEAVIIISKYKSQKDFLTPCTMRQHGV